MTHHGHCYVPGDHSRTERCCPVPPADTKREGRMGTIDEAAIWARRDRVLILRATTAQSDERRLAEEASGDDVPVLLAALAQVHGDLLSERRAFDETIDATDYPADGVWTRNHG